ncbi:hypothetical protein OPT61_g4583 [Boeremia exigua]|uniref:Uncharacterized protein n=1 Tax=Boeremia exigua TaxID=749465 RepID=A0ACC2IDK4_9PLEO|nr:hypothetical protein OPT61_g4583 [Boeremia exigua]
MPGAPPMPGDGSMPPPPPPPMPGMKRPGFLPKGSFNAPGAMALSGPRPKKKMKALHWDKVDSPSSTVWATHGLTAEEKEEKYQELSKKGVLDEVEKLFLAKEIKQIGKKGSKKEEKKQIISRDLMHNFQISMAKFSSFSVEEVVQMIIHCDKKILDDLVVMEFLQKNDFSDVPDNTAKLMAPYSKDWTVSNHGETKREQDPNDLTREDQIYLYTAFELHSYWKSRMRALALTRTFEIEYDEISNKLLEISRVSESLRSSSSLISVLGLILDIGNFMNDANKQANGFKLSTLSRLGMLKDDKNESTFADVVERIVRNQYPGWEGFTEEISGVVTAQKINVEQLQTDAKKYIDNVKNIQMSLDAGNLSDPSKFHPEDKVSIVVQRHMKDARRKAEQLQVFLEDMQKSYDDIMAFYGEDPTDDSSRREFFAKLANFVLEWKKSKEKNTGLEEQHRRNEISMRRKQQQQQVASPTATSDDGAPKSPASTGAMDDLLQKLRAAKPEARDQRDRRRRARLKDRHQVRVASGQQIPEIGVNMEEDGAAPWLCWSRRALCNGKKQSCRVAMERVWAVFSPCGESAVRWVQGNATRHRQGHGGQTAALGRTWSTGTANFLANTLPVPNLVLVALSLDKARLARLHKPHAVPVERHQAHTYNAQPRHQQHRATLLDLHPDGAAEIVDDVGEHQDHRQRQSRRECKRERYGRPEHAEVDEQPRVWKVHGREHRNRAQQRTNQADDEEREHGFAHRVQAAEAVVE